MAKASILRETAVLESLIMFSAAKSAEKNITADRARLTNMHIKTETYIIFWVSANRFFAFCDAVSLDTAVEKPELVMLQLRRYMGITS